MLLHSISKKKECFMLNSQSGAAGQVVSLDEQSQSPVFIWNILKRFSCSEKCLCQSK